MAPGIARPLRNHRVKLPRPGALVRGYNRGKYPGVQIRKNNAHTPSTSPDFPVFSLLLFSLPFGIVIILLEIFIL